ncbi:MAG: hypothetical protein R3C20_14545 [Planctomycetaceae bacterium]
MRGLRIAFSLSLTQAAAILEDIHTQFDTPPRVGQTTLSGRLPADGMKRPSTPSLSL